ncbi:MAG TPA: sugar phosphate isomerase/epimerase [Chitinophagaceae bacterium]|nr:sugar phosphate isomerase/epimerase [Chitinophagaceae bacterium]HNU15888.1 sugar phosphate isomerase/epimerase [Chitinophagaceae bacterium]
MKKYFIGVLFLLVHDYVFSKYGNKNNWKLSIQTWTFHKYSFLQSVEKADSLGVKFLEVYPGQKVGGDIQGAFSYTLDKDSRDKLKQFLEYRGIKVVALGVVDKEYYSRDNLEKFFEFAKYMNIPFITAEPEWEDLDEFNRLAAKYKVKVALHCHPKPSSHYWHPDSTVAAMNGRQHIGAWPDIGHWARNGVNIQDAMKKVEGRIWGLHLKDIKEFDNTAAEDTLLGLGVCDIPAVMNELKRQKFKGVVSIEYEVNPHKNMSEMQQNVLYYLGQLGKL